MAKWFGILNELGIWLEEKAFATSLALLGGVGWSSMSSSVVDGPGNSSSENTSSSMMETSKIIIRDFLDNC